MKKTLFAISLLSLMGCEPHNTNWFGSQVQARIYCDSCHISIHNTYYTGSGNLSDQGSTMSGNINDSIVFLMNRYEGVSCIKITEFTNLGNDSAMVWIIEGNDTLGVEINGTSGQCY